MENSDLLNLNDGAPPKEEIEWKILLGCAHYNKPNLLRRLLKFPEINVNISNFSKNTALHLACEKGSKGAIEVFLEDTRVDINRTNELDETPLYLLMMKNDLSQYQEIIKLFLKNLQIEVNVAPYGITLLYFVFSHKHEEIAKYLLLTPGIDIHWSHKNYMPSGSPLMQHREQCKALATRTPMLDFMESTYFSADMIASNDFKMKYREVMKYLKEHEEWTPYLPFVQETYTNRLSFLSAVPFALQVFLSDEYLTLKSSTEESSEQEKRTIRFFQIGSKLPMDLQMVLMNRLYGSGKDIISNRIVEPAFQAIAKSFLA